MNILYNVKHSAEFMREMFGHMFLFLQAFLSSRATLDARVVALQSQLALTKNRIGLKKDPKSKFTPAFRILWVILSKVLRGWEDLAALMQSATVNRWHSTAFRFYWRWKSRCRSVGRLSPRRCRP